LARKFLLQIQAYWRQGEQYEISKENSEGLRDLREWWKSHALLGLTGLMSAETNRRIDRVIIEHPDRLCRGVKGIRFLLQIFAKHGVHIYFADWRTEKTDANELLHHVEAMVAFGELNTDTYCSADAMSWLA
jgi:predicted site-specific integrase-resolvase